MTLCTAPSMTPRQQVRERRPGRPPSGKRLAMARASLPGKVRAAARRSLDPCDNSNDSGLGFDHHMDLQHSVNMNDRLMWTGERAEAKRPRLDIKIENDEFSDNYSFPDTIRNCKESTSLIRTAPNCSGPSMGMSSNQGASQGRAVPRCIPFVSRHSSTSPVTLTTQLSNASRYTDNISLSILKQPEQQHRARYQTEGSRGAVKDRDGNGFPIVQLTGYHKPATLQVFIGTDVGKVAPHMFYQACRVSGKNSTPCTERKIDGTIVIELQLDPTKDMLATCDCVGILKERNVDVEHRFPDQLGSRSKKKSTRCRMIFRTTITHDDGVQETLQVCSQPIVCTQPPGIPEICKKSLASCPATGGLELFVLGKNFLKDTRIFFQQVDEDRVVRWEQSVAPDKEFLQQTHFVCVIPPFARTDITEPVTVRLYVVSSGKTSEPHQLVYTPANGAMPSVRVDQQPPPQFLSKMLWSSAINKQDQDFGMMPPPGTSMVPLSARRSSTNIASSSEVHSPPVRVLKQELLDESSQSSIMDPLELRQERYRHLSESSLDVHQGDSNMSMINDNSIDMLRHNGMSMDMMNPNINENSNMMNHSSMDMIRRSSVNRPVSLYENSMEVTMSGSNLSALNEDSTCSTVMPCDRMVSQTPIMKPMMIPSSAVHMDLANNLTPDDIKGIDLRMKMPIATVSDLMSTSAPSLATLHKFGITEASSAPLPAQSAQSIENYLTTLESPTKSTVALSQTMTETTMKDKIAQILNTDANIFTQKLLNSQVMPTQTLSANMLQTSTQTLSNLGSAPVTESDPIFMTSQQQNFQKTSQNSTVSVVMKNEAEQSTTAGTPINTEKLDALVNSAVENHIGSPPSGSSSPKVKQSPKSDIMLSSQDVMLNTRSSLIVSPVLANTPSPSEPLSHSSPNIASDVILNPQISPSIICRSAQDSLLPGAMESNLIQPQITIENLPQQAMSSLLTTTTPDMNSSLHSSLPNLTASVQAEKEILFKATVGLLQTQKEICNLDKSLSNGKSADKIHIMNELLSSPQNISQLSSTGNNFAQSEFVSTATSASNVPLNIPPKPLTDNKPGYPVIPVPVKEMDTSFPASHDKKNEDRMIPPAFAAMSETDLINIINPSCFDQGNNFQ